MCKIMKNLWPLLLACFLWLAAGSCSQAEEMYQISENELTQLETNLQTLKAHSQERQKVLTEQATLLNQQKETIKKQAEELRRLKKEIVIAKTANEETKKSLLRANRFLQQFEDEAKRKIRVKTRQRDLWIAIAGGVLYAYVRK
nr:MAG TPA_asm: Peptidoglycan endopeptidase [Caudoviricetes sp.]